MTDLNELVSVRYLVDDVDESIAFYTKHLGFEVRTSFAPAFADVTRGNLRLLLSGPTSSAGRPMPDGATPGPGGWNRIHLIVDDIAARGGPAPQRRGALPQRHRHRARRPADPDRGPVREHRRALPARGHLTRHPVPQAATPSRLARRLGTTDAVAIGLGSMIGAGIFAAVGPASQAAGSGITVALLIAGAVAFANATSSAQLAAVYPESGGTYVYGRERLGAYWGFLAGWGFVIGKTASCAAMALTLGLYVAPGSERIVALAAIAVLTAVNCRGIQKTAVLTKVVLAIVLTALAVVVASGLGSRGATFARLDDVGSGGVTGILQAAGLLFFAFAGYARIATLGEEVTRPAPHDPAGHPDRPGDHPGRLRRGHRRRARLDRA